MSLLHESDVDDRVRDDGPVRTFRAATIEAALADARAELGADVHIIEANRIRRGGVGGFFATELGVELVVRPNDDASDPTNDLDAAGVRLLDPGYFADEPLERPASPPHEPAAANAWADVDRPHIDDRQFGEDTSDHAAPPGIERLLEAAGRAERGELPRSSRSFAAHLARQLRADRASDLVATPSRRPIADAATGRDPSMSSAPAAPAAAARGASPAARATVEANEAVAAEVIGERRRSEMSHRSGNPSDRMGSPFDLAAGAVGRIVEQLSGVAPAAGSRVNDLSRLVVKVTMDDGAVIEIAAELDGGRDV
jgi:flagellar biosynthesis GTPase FlhF